MLTNTKLLGPPQNQYMRLEMHRLVHRKAIVFLDSGHDNDITGMNFIFKNINTLNSNYGA